MMKSPLRILVGVPLALTMLLVTAACGSSGGTATGPTPATPVASCPGGNGATGSISAQINGVSWVAVCVKSATFFNGIVSFAGSDNVADVANAQVIGIATQASGPGTFPISLANGANGQLTIGGTQVWEANAVLGGSGTITITILTATGTSGTFSFNLIAVPPATGTKTITNGVFNLTF
jgi:hypothetical protein